MRALLVLAFVALGCAGDPLPLTNCTAGVQTACACPGGSQGAQRCAADGSGYGACDCAEVDAGALDAPAGDAAAVVDVDRSGADAASADAGDVVAVGDDGRLPCPAGQARCPGGPACIDTMTNPDNCGGCGRQCGAPDADTTCVRGVCAIGGCRAGRRDCDGTYANGCEVQTVCGGRCSSAGVCLSDERTLGGCEAGDIGRCRCLTHFGDCDGDIANGCETDLRVSSTNCGECGRRCATGQTCRPATTASPPGICRAM